MSFIELKVWLFFLIILVALKVASSVDKRINYRYSSKKSYYDDLGVGPWYASLLYIFKWAVGIRIFIAFTDWFFKSF